jgi:hypothetical protein
MDSPPLVERTVSRLTAHKPVRFQINAITKVGRAQLRDVLSEFFTRENLERTHVLPIHYAIVEIVFNALKANVKFVAFREEIRKQLDRFKITEIEDLLQVIIEEKTLREFMAARVLPQVLRHQVQKIFDLEEKYRSGMGARLTAEQIELIKRFRTLIRSIDAEVTLTITPSADSIHIRCVNNAPMLQRDLDRIEASRRRHQQLHAEGRGGDFFEYGNIDTTESAGFGIAMVDQGFYRLGLDPFKQIKIQSLNRETVVELIYPRSALEKA